VAVKEYGELIYVKHKTQSFSQADCVFHCIEVFMLREKSASPISDREAKGFTIYLVPNTNITFSFVV